MALAAPSAVVTRARRSTSAVSYSDSEARDVGAQLDKISHLVRGSGGSATEAIQAAQVLRQLVTDSATPHRLRDAFRTHRGFLVVLDMQRWAADQPAVAAESDRQFEVLRAGFQLLSTMLKDHWGNQRFFRNKVALQLIFNGKNDSGVYFPATERHEYTHALLHGLQKNIRNLVGESSF